MEFTKSELKNAVSVLLKSENEDANRVGYTLAKIMYDPECGGEYDLINRNHYIATILWQTEDVKGELEEQGFEGSDENAAIVINEGLHGSLEDCSSGWEPSIA